MKTVAFVSWQIVDDDDISGPQGDQWARKPYNLNEHEKEASNQNRVLAERTQSAQPPWS